MGAPKGGNENPRLSIGLVLAVALLIGVVAVRHALRGRQAAFDPDAAWRAVPAATPRPRAGTSGWPGTGGRRMARLDESQDNVGDEGAPLAGKGRAGPARAPAPAASQPAAEPPPARAADGSADGPNAENPEPPERTPRMAEGILAPALSVPFQGSAMASDSTEPALSEDVQFDETVGAAVFSPQSMLAYADRGGVDPSAGTFAFWIRMDWDPEQAGVEGKTLAELRTGTWENRFEIHMGPRFMGFLVTNSEGAEQGVGAPLRWQHGEWHHVAATWGEALIGLYVDGALQQQREFVGSIELPPNAQLYVGSTRNRTVAAQQGTVALRGWGVYQRELSAEEIMSLAAQTLPKG